MNQKTFDYRSFASILVWCIAILYGVILIEYAHGYEEQIDWLSVVHEGAMALMPAIGLAIITKIEHRNVYRLLFLGLTLLVIALLTDAIDEFVQVPRLITHLCEGACQVVGFLILILGLREWIIYNRDMNVQLRYQATTDPLTGIANRRVFLAELESEMERLKRFPSPLSLILIDLDYFKQVNDTYGHLFGDDVLKKVADDVGRNIRDIDVFARFGGEEFIIAARETDRAKAINLAEKIHLVMHEIAIGDLNGIHASFGISHYREGDSPKDLIKRADDALYRAKASGRNTICAEEEAEPSASDIDRIDAQAEVPIA